MATSIFDAAAKFANVIVVPLVALAFVQFGWRWGFGITGMLSFLYFLAFLTGCGKSRSVLFSEQSVPLSVEVTH